MSGTDAVDDWFAAAGAREAELRRVDALVVLAAPGIDRQLVPAGSTSMLGYGLMPYRPRSAKESTTWPLIALAAQKRHLSLYVCAVVDGAYLPDPGPSGWAGSRAARAASGSPRSTAWTPRSSARSFATPSPRRRPGVTGSSPADRAVGAFGPWCAELRDDTV